MKSPKERQRAYRERRKEQKKAGLIKLKILTSAAAGKNWKCSARLTAPTSVQCSAKPLNCFGHNVSATRAFTEEKSIDRNKRFEPEKAIESQKEKKKNPRKKEVKPEEEKVKPRAKASKNKPETVLVATI